MASEKLKMLFQAFRDDDESTFYRTAESIIASELAANHHSTASDLKKSLGNRETLTKRNSQMNGLTLLPKDRRSGDELVALKESRIDQTKIVLGKKTKPKIDRILVEHRKRNQLAKYGFSPKNKLLFWGPPGCGKTLTAYYLAHELGLPIGILRLNAVISSFLGDTASHIQRVFDFANSKPMVLLLDEVDAVGKNRDDSNDVGELKRVVNSFLQAIDFFNSSQSIIIAASNHQYLLDPALWRRFDDIVSFPLPEKPEREKYLQKLLNGVHFQGTTTNVASKMNSFSFADIERVTIEAIKTMILEGRSDLCAQDILEQIKSHRIDLSTSKFKQEITTDE